MSSSPKRVYTRGCVCYFIYLFILFHPLQRLTTPPRSTSPTLFEQRCGFFYVPQEPDEGQCCETGPTVFLPSISEKTSKSNRLQMLLMQRQHFLLSHNLRTSVQQTGAFPTELTRRPRQYGSFETSNRVNIFMNFGSLSKAFKQQWSGVRAPTPRRFLCSNPGSQSLCVVSKI